jgi:hypothetical protein
MAGSRFCGAKNRRAAESEPDVKTASYRTFARAFAESNTESEFYTTIESNLSKKFCAFFSFRRRHKPRGHDPRCGADSNHCRNPDH